MQKEKKVSYVYLKEIGFPMIGVVSLVVYKILKQNFTFNWNILNMN